MTDEGKLLEFFDKRVAEIEAATGLAVLVIDPEGREEDCFAMLATPDGVPVSIVDVTNDMVGDLDRLVQGFMRNGTSRCYMQISN